MRGWGSWEGVGVAGRVASLHQTFSDSGGRDETDGAEAFCWAAACHGVRLADTMTQCMTDQSN